MKATLTLFVLFCTLLAAALFASGCGGGSGGGGGGGTTTAPVKMTISWAARSRTINAPSSAQSATLTLVGANPSGGDFIYTVNRNVSPGAYSQDYTSTASAKIGKTTATIVFYAGAGGAGATVGSATAVVTIAADGTGIGDVAVTGTVATTTVNPGQFLKIGATLQLTFSVRDAKGVLIAVTPGSATWAVVSGPSILSVTPDGIASGIAQGSAGVTATVDGKVSMPAGVEVLTNGVASYSIAAVTGTGIPNGVTVYPNWINNAGDIVGYYAQQAAPQQVAFIIKGGVATQLGPVPGGVGSVASCVNDIDQVVGFYGSSLSQVGASSGTAFIWQGGAYTFPDSTVTVSPSVPPRINQAGQVLRTVQGPDGIPHTLLRTGTTDVDINQGSFAWSTGGPGTVGIALNNFGEITGTSQPSQSGAFQPYVWQNGSFSTFSAARPSSISDIGQVTCSSPTQAYLVDSSLAVALLGQVSNEVVQSMIVNNAGQIVGTIGSNVVSPWHAVLYDTQRGIWVDLNNLIPAANGWVLQTPTCINDKGQIIGVGTLNGTTTGFILTPAS